MSVVEEKPILTLFKLSKNKMGELFLFCFSKKIVFIFDLAMEIIPSFIIKQN